MSKKIPSRVLSIGWRGKHNGYEYLVIG